MKLSFKIEMPAPAPAAHPKITALEKVKSYIDDIEDGCGSEGYQWEYLKSLWNLLQLRKHLSSSEMDLLELIEPTIMKYCQFDPPFAKTIDGTKLNRATHRENE